MGHSVLCDNFKVFGVRIFIIMVGRGANWGTSHLVSFNPLCWPFVHRGRFHVKSTAAVSGDCYIRTRASSVIASLGRHDSD